jgi:hypothetical protein
MPTRIPLPEGMSVEEAQRILNKKPSKAAADNSEPIVFQEIEAGPNQIIRVHKSSYRGREVLSIQKFWREDENQEWQFGKGCTFNDEAIDDIIIGLQKMKQYLQDNPR